MLENNSSFDFGQGLSEAVKQNWFLVVLPLLHMIKLDLGFHILKVLKLFGGHLHGQQLPRCLLQTSGFISAAFLKEGSPPSS